MYYWWANSAPAVQKYSTKQPCKKQTLHKTRLENESASAVCLHMIFRSRKHMTNQIRNVAVATGNSELSKDIGSNESPTPPFLAVSNLGTISSPRRGFSFEQLCRAWCWFQASDDPSPPPETTPGAIALVGRTWRWDWYTKGCLCQASTIGLVGKVVWQVRRHWPVTR